MQKCCQRLNNWLFCTAPPVQTFITTHLNHTLCIINGCPLWSQWTSSWGPPIKHAEDLCFGLSAGRAQNLPCSNFPPYLHKLLQGWVNKLQPSSSGHCYSRGIVSDAILSSGLIRGSCGNLQSDHVRLCKLINISGTAGKVWFSPRRPDDGCVLISQQQPVHRVQSISRFSNKHLKRIPAPPGQDAPHFPLLHFSL